MVSDGPLALSGMKLVGFHAGLDRALELEELEGPGRQAGHGTPSSPRLHGTRGYTTLTAPSHLGLTAASEIHDDSPYFPDEKLRLRGEETRPKSQT